MVTSALVLENTYFGVLMYQKVSPDDENLFGLTIKGTHVDFYKICNLSLYPMIAYFRVVWYHELSNENEDLSGSTI